MFPETFMLSTRSLCRSSVSRAGKLVWFDRRSRPVTKVSAARVHTYGIPTACLTTHVKFGRANTGLIVSRCRHRSSNMTWGTETPAEVAAALPHYAQVMSF